MKKTLLIIILMIITTNTALGVDMCGDVVTPNEECVLVTPVVVGCADFNYSVTNVNTNTTVDSGNLTGFYDDIYLINFSQPRGDYLVKLCDDTTREITSGGDDEMAWNSILIALIAMTAVLGVTSFMIQDKNLKPIKMVFFVLFVVNGLMIGILSYIISVNPFNVDTFQPLGLGYAGMNVMLILGFMFNYLFSRFGKVYKSGVQKFSGFKGGKAK